MRSSIIRRWIIQRNWLSQFYSRGLLFHRQVADYAYDDNWKRMFTVGINYISRENWISDGKYYSSSTTTAAMDMALGLISDMLDIDIAEKIAEEIG